MVFSPYLRLALGRWPLYEIETYNQKHFLILQQQKAGKQAQFYFKVPINNNIRPEKILDQI